MKRKYIGIIAIAISLYFGGNLSYHHLLTSLAVPTPKENVLKEQVIQQGEETKEKFKLYAQSAALLDATNGRILYEKDGYREMPMASTTKIMTCLIILENANLEDTVTVSKYASKQPDVQLNIVQGEAYNIKDLLYSLMLESHNDVAVALAEHIGAKMLHMEDTAANRSEEQSKEAVAKFAEIMTEKAKALGCEHTQFVTPNGLDANGHYTTAEELCKIGAYAIQNKDFLEITNTASWNFKEKNKGRAHTVTNKDRFLYLYDGAIGIKTGFTGKAGACVIIERNV